MAAPITHIVLAKEFLQHYPAVSGGDNFIVGESFPDIRYLGVITREETHDPEVGLQDILNASDAFLAGVKHHVLVDLVREKFIQDRDIYSSAPKSGYITQAIKLFEDETLYGRIDDWGIVASMLENTIDQEREFPVTTNDIERWHDVLREYIACVPTIDSRERLIGSIGFTPEAAKEIEHIIRSLKSSEVVSSVIHDMYQDFTSLIREWPRRIDPHPKSTAEKP